MWKEFWAIYWKRIIGAVTGLLLGILYLIVGFWDTLVVGLFIAAGFWYGKQKELTNGSVFPWQRIWDNIMERFRPFR